MVELACIATPADDDMRARHHHDVFDRFSRGQPVGPAHKRRRQRAIPIDPAGMPRIVRRVDLKDAPGEIDRQLQGAEGGP